jgi:hypothetical protein
MFRRIQVDYQGEEVAKMPVHQFTTPRVVYIGLAYGGKEAPQARAATRTRQAGSRPARDRVAQRRSAALSPSTIR